MSSRDSDQQTTSVRISSTHNPIKVIAEVRQDVWVEGNAKVAVRGNQTTIDGVAGMLVVHVPEQADLVVGSTSGGVTVEGPMGDVAIVSESGRVRVENAKSIDARTTNGSVDVGDVEGDCRIRTTSGSVVVQGCGPADVAADSGRIRLKGVRGTARAHCVSGRVEIHLEAAVDVDAETVSGRVAVSYPPGVRAYQSGNKEPESLPDDCDCTVCATSVSGRVVVSSR